MNNKNLLFAVLCVPLLLTTACGKKKSGTDTQGSESERDTSDLTGVDDTTVKKYMDDLSKASQGDHFYYHYLRYKQTSADFNQWDMWIWPYRPNEGQGVRFDWVGRTTSADRMSATGNPVIDDFGYASIDVDLTKSYDGGWDAATKKMGGIPVNFVKDGVMSTRIGTQVVNSASRTSDSGFWKNDGGNVYITLEDYALKNSDGSTSYHVFTYEDHAAKPSPVPVVSYGEIYDPFDGDKGENVTYGKSEYNTANWTDKPIQASSEAFKNGAGVGYQIMVSSFADSDGDGFGDIYGIEQKLPYLKNLGVKVLWLTPIQKSDSYHGYDIADYLTVDSKFGSAVSPAAEKALRVTEETAKADYKSLIDAAHDAGMLVVMDLVLNHTSTTNNWFISSAQLDKATRGYYQWGNNETQAEQINETNYWYPYGDHVYSYYAKFGSSMPELNYAYASTRAAVEAMAKNWCEFGVDGFRMDAVKHIFLEDEIDRDNNDTYITDVGSGINYSSDLTKNLNFWKELNYEVKKDYPKAFFVGENFDGHAYHVAPFYEGFDSLFDFYSYFNLTSIASAFYNNKNTGAYQGYHAASFLGQWNSTATKYSADSDTDLSGNKSKSIKYGDGWNLAGVLNTNNKYRTGGNDANATSGYEMINGAFTSNHDIARAINRIAGNQYDNNGLIAQGEVTSDNYDKLLNYATLVEIVELMLPGLTWIYYGDELGMTGNFGKDVTEKTGYADLSYRQPMKWEENGVIGDGSMTTGYSISGSDRSVEWNDINSTSLVAPASEQIKENNPTSHYNILAKFANAKNSDQALINGLYEPYYKDITNSALQESVISFTRTLGNKSYRVVANIGNSAVTLTSGGKAVASYNGATASNVPAKAAVLIDLGGSVEPATKVNYTVNGVPESWTDASDYYVWAWGGSNGDGAKINATLNAGTITFNTYDDISGFKVLKVKKGASWNSSSWNTNLEDESKDITVTPGTTTYTFPTTSNVTYTITGVPSSWTSGSDYYAWAWGGSAGQGAKIAATLVNGNLTFESKNDITGFLLVKVKKGATWTNTSWSTNLEAQSGDFSVKDGVTTYTFVSK